MYIERRVWANDTKVDTIGYHFEVNVQFYIAFFDLQYCAFYEYYLFIYANVVYFANGYILYYGVSIRAQFAECNDCHNFIMSFNINNLE